MKKKFISTLLLGAFFLASTSMVLSCKDYDDDINANTAKINSLQTTLESEIANLKSDCAANLATAKAYADAAAKTAQSTAEATAAKDAADKAAAALEEAKKYSDAQDIAKAAATLASAEAYADSLAKVAADNLAAQSKVDQAYAQAAADKAKLEALQEAKTYADGLYSNLDAKLTTNKADCLQKIADVIAKMNAVDSTLNAKIDANYTGLNNGIIANKTAINQMEITVKADSTYIQYLKTSGIPALEGKIADVQTNVDKVKTDLQAEIDALKKVDVAYKKTLDSLANITTTLDGKITDAKNSAIATSKNYTDTQITDLINTYIKPMQTNISTNADNIAKVKAAMQHADSVQQKNIDELSGKLTLAVTNLEGKIKADSITSAKALTAFKAAVGTRGDSIINALNSAVTAIYAKVKSDSTTLNQISKTFNTAMIDSCKSLQKQYTAAINDVQTNLDNKITTLNSTLTLFINQTLTSIVLRPDSYFEMMGAVELQCVEVPIFTNQNVVADDTLKSTAGKFATWTKKVDAAKSTTNSILAHYHFNPANADISDYTWGCNEVATQNTQTRAHNDTTTVGLHPSTPVAQGNGIYAVTFKADNLGNLNDATQANGSWVTTFALQGTNKNTKRVITSDYAILMPTYIKDVILVKGVWDNHNQAYEGGHMTVDPTAAYGIAQYNLNRNATESAHIDKISNGQCTFTARDGWKNGGFDLNLVSGVHYTASNTANSAVANSVTDKVMSNDQVKALGWTYEYKVMHYTIDKNRGDESKYVSVVNNHLVIAAKDSINAIGSLPIVRVVLKDNKQNVIAVGYVNFMITVGTNPYEYDAQAYTDEIYLNCDKNNVFDEVSTAKGDTVKAAIKDIQNLINTHFGVTNFTSSYYKGAVGGFEGDASTGVLAQFVKKGTKYTDVAAADTLGEVKLMKNKKGTADSLITWSITSKNLFKLFYRTDKNGNLVPRRYSVDPVTKDTSIIAVDTFVVVKYQSADTLTKAPDVYVTLHIDGTKLHSISGKFDNSNKIYSYWYENAAGTAGSGYGEMRANVNPTPNMTDVNPFTLYDTTNREFDGYCDFNYNMLDGFVGNRATISVFDAKKYTSWTAHKGYDMAQFYIAENASGRKVPGISGATYTIYPSADRDTLYAYKTNKSDKQVVLTLISKNYDGLNKKYINPDTLVHNMIQYNRLSDYATDILNYCETVADKDASGLYTGTYTNVYDNSTAFYVTIGMSELYQPCDIPMYLTNNTFNVRFLRPVQFQTSKDIQVTDGAQDMSSFKFYVGDWVKFKDWRNYSFGGSKGDNTPYLVYYNIKSITPDTVNIKTDLNRPTAAATSTSFDRYADAELLSKVTSNAFYLRAGNVKSVNDYEEFGVNTKTTFGSWDWDVWRQNLGYMQYINNNATVGTFHLWVPIKVTYEWGTSVRMVVMITVHKTINNAKKN